MDKNYNKISKNPNKSLQPAETTGFEIFRFDLSSVSVNEIWFYTVKLSRKGKE
jgi:hypothetical protein